MSFKWNYLLAGILMYNLGFYNKDINELLGLDYSFAGLTTSILLGLISWLLFFILINVEYWRQNVRR